MAFDAVPVTSPVKSPTKLVEVVTPVANISPSGLKVTPVPMRVSFLNVAIPATSKIPVLTFAVPPIPVNSDPSPTNFVAVIMPEGPFHFIVVPTVTSPLLNNFISFVESPAPQILRG